MISLNIARFERLSEAEKNNMGLKYDDTDAYEHLVFVDRRVGFDVMKYFEECYKIPFYYIGDERYQKEGEKILLICSDCFGNRMYDENQDTYYCPRCDG